MAKKATPKAQTKRRTSTPAQPQLTTTRNTGERHLLAQYRNLTPNGKKALQAWAELIERLQPAPVVRRDARRTAARRTR